jgi:hypothetical protein
MFKHNLIIIRGATTHICALNQTIKGRSKGQQDAAADTGRLKL